MTPSTLSDIRPDASAALQFLKALDPDASKFNLRSFSDKGGGARRHDNVPLALIPRLLDECVVQSRGLFVVANDGGQRNAEIQKCRAIFLDLDAKEFSDAAACAEAMRLAHEGRRTINEPIPSGWPHASIVVRSGGGGYHLYWLVDEFPIDLFTSAQKAVAARFGGDLSVCDLSRVMRLPGSVHFKCEPVAVQLALCRPERRYKFDDLLQRLGVTIPVSPPRTSAAGVADDPGTDPVLSHLHKQFQYLKRGGRCDGNAPVDVICPNRRAHSDPDGVTSTVYMPQGFNEQPRGFKCSHGHCGAVSLRDFLVSIGYEQDCPPSDSDDGQACRFVNWLDGRAMHARSQWHVLSGAHWRPDRNAVVLLLKQFAKKFEAEAATSYVEAVKSGDERATKTAARTLRAASALLNTRKQGDVLKAASAMLERDAIALDTHHDLLCVPNGIVDLQTGALLPPSAEFGFTLCAGVAFDPSATAPRFEQFIREVFPDPTERAYLQRWCGYCLTGQMRADVMAIWTGSGANGKSVLADALAQVLGDYAISAEPSLLIGRSQAAGGASPDVARLVGKRLCYVNESRVGDRLNDGQVKRLVSTDKVTARGLFRDPFDFYPTAKIVLRTNAKPQVDDNSDGMWRRLHLLPFTQSFTGKRRDDTLGGKLRTELPGILAWCVRGAVEWYSKGLEPPASVQAATEAYRADSDDFVEWLGACVEEGGFTSTTALRDSHARHAGLKFPMTERQFKAKMMESGVKRNRTSKAKGYAVTLLPPDVCEFV